MLLRGPGAQGGDHPCGCHAIAHRRWDREGTELPVGEDPVSPVEGDDELGNIDVLEFEDEVDDDDDADVVDDPGVEPSDGKDETDEEAAGALADPGIGLSGKFGGKMSGGGLRPPGESSVAPNGMPTRPTGCGRPCASGDEADAPSRVGVVAGGAHGSDALLVLPPPSKSVLAPPTVEHAVLLVFDGGGLRPGVASSSAPIGTPTGGTADPGPIPSGDVTPSGEAVGPT
jgi:hypothetical protein